MARTTTVIDPNDPAYAGQESYTPGLLRIYDTVVVHLSNRYVWRCSSQRLVQLYEDNVGRHHVDAGPGTGYFLDVPDLPQLERLTLVDANPNVLEHTAKRVDRYSPERVEANVFAPIEHPGGADSVGCNYLLHCLPGSFEDKGEAIANLARLLRPGGVLFGSTILAEGHSAIGRRLMTIYNKKGIFGNEHDTLGALERMLSTHLIDVEIEVVGAVAIFRGRRPS
ncbi:MAG: class I SAM-dependent methyltransferase [Nitriliruptorales bacterium]|nr:class I SAM-dependent methyltransferase [Nitriliruptorales bacterium]